MPFETFRFMIVLLGIIVVFARMCIAGTWIDNFSDPTLQDWGGGLINDEVSATVVDGRFNFRGKKQEANHRMANWELGDIQDFSLELKFMVRNVRNPADSGWSIQYEDFNEETRKLEGILDFGFSYGHGVFVEPNVAFVRIIWSVPEHNPKIGPVVLHEKSFDIARFAYEKEVWYMLKIERVGNQFIFWIGDFGLFVDDDLMPVGTIGFHFYGRCNIWLDDFIVTGADVLDGGPGVLQVKALAKQLTTTWGNLKAQN